MIRASHASFFVEFKFWKSLIWYMGKMLGKVLIWVLGAVVCIVLGFYAQKKGTEFVREMRQMERVPKVSANHVISGEVSIEGIAEKSESLLFSRYTNTPCVYHRYLKEKEKKDSDGDTTWVTVEKGSESTDFFINDDTGKVLVKLMRGSFTEIR